MFDLSWAELLFCAVLALLVVGPKDMPKLIKILGQSVSKAKRLYRDAGSSLTKLEREIDLAQGTRTPEPWREMVAESARFLPEDFIPGSMTAEQHQQRRAAFEQARNEHKKKKEQIEHKEAQGEQAAQNRSSRNSNADTDSLS